MECAVRLGTRRGPETEPAGDWTNPELYDCPRGVDVPNPVVLRSATDVVRLAQSRNPDQSRCYLLVAVHRRAAELEARLDAAERTVRSQAERLARHDEQLRAALDELGRAKDRFFRRLDRDRSRSLDARELQQGLAELGLALDMAEAEGVCRRWDRDGSGTLDLEEFLRALRPPMSQAREAVIAAAFSKLDRSGDGVVTVDDLRGVYSCHAHPKVQSGEWTEEEVLRRFLDNFDSSEKDGQVTLAEFQDYYSGVSASMDTDEEFVAMMTSAWRL